MLKSSLEGEMGKAKKRSDSLRNQASNTESTDLSNKALYLSRCPRETETILCKSHFKELTRVIAAMEGERSPMIWCLRTGELRKLVVLVQV